MLKKSAIVLSYSCGMQCAIPTPPVSKTSSSARQSSRRQPDLQSCRSYAMISGDRSRNNHKYIPWPEVSSINAIPSPYQIFNQRKGSPYSKQRFYELVKLYHPDRHKHAEVDGGIPYATKLERYRLVVAANEILCDPVKRGAYDLYGAGWNGQPEVRGGGSHPGDDTGNARGTYSGRGWYGDPKGPSQNATWEDWERWYNRDAKGKQEPTYFSNSAFVSFIVILAALGGIGQATRVGNYSLSMLEQRDALHDEMSKELRKRRKETASIGTREERIQAFLRNRDPFGYGLRDPRDSPDTKLLPAPEVQPRTMYGSSGGAIHDIPGKRT